MTDELLEDVAVLESFISKAFAEEFGFKIDDAILNGTGAGQPLGVYNAPAAVVVAKESGQAANTIVAANFAKLYARMPEANLARARWVFNQGCKQQIMTLSLTVGSQTYPMYVPGGITGRSLVLYLLVQSLEALQWQLSKLQLSAYRVM